jgi:hypothetical protein
MTSPPKSPLPGERGLNLLFFKPLPLRGRGLGRGKIVVQFLNMFRKYNHMKPTSRLSGTNRNKNSFSKHVGSMWPLKTKLFTHEKA